MTNGISEETPRQRAWSYYQHADNLQHQRHNIFVVAQSIFFAAYAQAHEADKVWPVVIAVGILYAVLWWSLSERLFRGMKALSDKHLKPDNKGNGDDVYGNYLTGLDESGHPSGRTVLNVLLPWLTVVAWLGLLLLKTCA